MSEKLTIEYVFSTIIPAWKNVVFHDPKIEQLALERGIVCRDCEFLNHFVAHKKLGKKCSVCGCPIMSKIRAVENGCPKGRWSK